MMRDPKYLEDPEIFLPERFEEIAFDFGVANFEYIPFGGGRRICPRASIALASIELWLAQLLFYFDWELLGGRSTQELDVEEAFCLILTRKNDLCLVATYHEYSLVLTFIREEEGNNLVKKIRMARRSPMNLLVMLLLLLNVTIVRAAIRKGCAQQRRFLLAMKKMFEYLSGFNVVDLFPSWIFFGEINGLRHGMKRVHMVMDSVLNEIIEEHEVTKMIKDLFVAGSDSSSLTLVWAMTELIRHPKVMQKAQLEVRKALNGKIRIEEGDKHKLPYINQTTELAGYTIPIKSQVVINVWAMMRDTKYWKDPEIFQPERFEEKEIDFGVANFEFIPFGGGRLICPGISFALASMEL
ncbi:hypothetical protein IEQ34_006846 [Dendrobium chrysotoxum]|uniref:Cytochrome P450 n=1 Tax=Dendrobium chrysotoxum TaxID=161865 RepID=A0AAV7H9B4_DENCH|nr:hypothetical protein IEQ34_006846 [Dendrobium chrysotoxum]